MKGNNFSYISWYNVGAHVAIFIPQKCRRSERYFRYKNTCPMLIKLGNIGKVFCMNGFPGKPEKKGHKTRRNESGNMAKSYFIYCIQSNLYHGLYRVRVLVVGSYSLGGWSARALFPYLLVYILQLSMEHISCYLGKSLARHVWRRSLMAALCHRVWHDCIFMDVTFASHE